jgi:VWFA-related protein
MRAAFSAVGVIAAGLFASAQQAPPHPQFRSTANLVVVPVVVVDGKGAFRSDLDVSAFQVFEDGRPVPIEVFLPPDESGAGADGRFIVLVLDNLRTPVELTSRVQSIARRFADRMQSGDSVSVIGLNAGRASGPGPAEVRAAINRFRGFVGESVRTGPELVSFGLETIAALAEQMAQAPQRRKVLVFIGSASIFSPHDPSAFFEREPLLDERWFEAVRATGRDNVSVYVIDPAGLTGVVDDYSEGFAELTGGQTWVNRGNLDRAVEQIWRESGSYYLIGYRAPDDRRLHKIGVKVGVPGLTVRARRSRG